MHFLCSLQLAGSKTSFATVLAVIDNTEIELTVIIDGNDANDPQDIDLESAEELKYLNDTVAILLHTDLCPQSIPFHCLQLI